MAVWTGREAKFREASHPPWQTHTFPGEDQEADGQLLCQHNLQQEQDEQRRGQEHHLPPGPWTDGAGEPKIHIVCPQPLSGIIYTQCGHYLGPELEPAATSGRSEQEQLDFWWSKHNQADFWVCVRHFYLCSMRNSDMNPKLGLLRFGQTGSDSWQLVANSEDPQDPEPPTPMPKDSSQNQNRTCQPQVLQI